MNFNLKNYNVLFLYTIIRLYWTRTSVGNLQVIIFVTCQQEKTLNNSVIIMVFLLLEKLIDYIFNNLIYF